MWYRRLDATFMLLNYFMALAWYPVSLNIELALPRGHLAPLAFSTIIVPGMLHCILREKFKKTPGLVVDGESRFIAFNCVVILVITIFSIAAEITDGYAMNCYPIPCAMRDYSGLVYVTLPIISDWKIDFGLLVGFSGLCSWAWLIVRCLLNWRIVVVSGKKLYQGEMMPTAPE